MSACRNSSWSFCSQMYHEANNSFVKVVFHIWNTFACPHCKSSKHLSPKTRTCQLTSVYWVGVFTSPITMSRIVFPVFQRFVQSQSPLVKDVANSRVYCRWTFLTASPDASVKFDWGEDLMLQIATFRRTCPSTRRHSHHSSQGYGLEEEIVIPVLDNLSTATPFKFQI